MRTELTMMGQGVYHSLQVVEHHTSEFVPWLWKIMNRVSSENSPDTGTVANFAHGLSLVCLTQVLLIGARSSVCLPQWLEGHRRIETSDTTED